MKLTLLEMTQSILSSMDSDPVNDIDETVEAIQVADIIRECFYDLMAERDWPFLHSITSFTGLGDLNNPTKMQIPENVNKVVWVKYNNSEVKYIPPEEFDNLIGARTPLANVIDANGFIINRDPLYFTSYDEKYVVFDGYDISVDNTLQQSKTKVYGVTSPSWTHVSTFVPDIPEKFFVTLLSEAKSQAFVNLKQQVNAREERKAQKGRIRLQSEVNKVKDSEWRYNRKVNYGRR